MQLPTLPSRRLVHVLDDNTNPEGPVLCGLTSVEVVGDMLRSTDRLCHRCATALLSRLNDYADRIDSAADALRASRGVIRRQQRLLDMYDRILNPPQSTEPEDEDGPAVDALLHLDENCPEFNEARGDGLAENPGEATCSACQQRTGESGAGSV